MRILITNDDGIGAPCLPLLADWAKRLGEVVVVAPKVEQSGKSHAIEIYKQIEIKEVDLGVSVRAYAMASTPADCVRFAVLGHGEHFDLILSGINRGFNLGKDIVYSGTVGAIFEGARLGIPAVALSTDFRDFTHAVSALDEVYDFFVRNELLSLGSLYNVNIPIDHKDIRITRQGDIYYTDEFEPIGHDLYVQKGHAVAQIGEDLTLDTDAVRGAHLSITPLRYDRTNYDVFDRLVGGVGSIDR